MAERVTEGPCAEKLISGTCLQVWDFATGAYLGQGLAPLATPAVKTACVAIGLNIPGVTVAMGSVCLCGSAVAYWNMRERERERR
jgi:hypothetical protein